MGAVLWKGAWASGRVAALASPLSSSLWCRRFLGLAIKLRGWKRSQEIVASPRRGGAATLAADDANCRGWGGALRRPTAASTASKSVPSGKWPAMTPQRNVAALIRMMMSTWFASFFFFDPKLCFIGDDSLLCYDNSATPPAIAFVSCLVSPKYEMTGIIFDSIIKFQFNFVALLTPPGALALVSAAIYQWIRIFLPPMCSSEFSISCSCRKCRVFRHHRLNIWIWNRKEGAAHTARRPHAAPPASRTNFND